jgi:hypothetical protein
MNPLKNFKEFVSQGMVKRISPNKNRADSLIKEAESKKSFLESVIKSMSKENYYPNFIVETCYDIILEFVRARMILDGFKSDSHEAEVSYMNELSFSNFEVRFVNELRYFRNGIKYYGKILDEEYADKVLDFLKKIYPKLKKLDKDASCKN